MAQENIIGNPTGLSIKDIDGGITTQPVRPETGLTEDSKAQRKLSIKDIDSGFGDTSSLVFPGSVAKAEKVLGEGQYHPELDPMYNQQLLHERQSATSVMVNSMGRFAIEVGATALSTLAYDSDLTLGTDLAENTQKEFGNGLSRFAEKMQDWGQEKMPIYVDPYKVGKFDPGSLSWWGENGVSVGSSIGMIAPAMILAAATGGIAGALGMGAIAESTAFRGITTALWSRHAENLMEASGVYKQAYQEAKAKGMSDFDAKNVASLGASNTYKKQWALLAQDIPQYILFNKLGALGKGGAAAEKTAAKEMTGEVADWFGKSRLSTLAGKTGAVAMDMAGEGGEEIYQFLVNEQSNIMATQAANPDKELDHSIGTILKNNYDNGDMWTAGFFGAIGAGVMQAGMHGLNYKVMQKMAAKQIEDLRNYGATLNQSSTEYGAALASGDPIKAEEALPSFLVSNRIKNIVHGTQKYADQMFSELEKGIDPETAQKWGISIETQNRIKEDPEFAKKIKDGNARIDQLYKQFKKDALNNKKVKSPQDAEAIAQVMTNTQFILESTKSNLSKIISRKEEALSKIKDFEKISPTGKEIMKNKAETRGEQILLDAFIKQRDTATEKLGEEEKEQLTLDIEQSGLRIDKLKTELKELGKTYRKEKVTTQEGVELSAKDNDLQYVVPEDQIDLFRKEVGREIAANKVIEHFTNNLKKLKEGKTPHVVQKENAEEFIKQNEQDNKDKTGDISNGDIVSFTGEDGKYVSGKVIDIQGDSYTVHPVDPTTMEPVGETAVVKPEASLYVDKKLVEQPRIEVAPEELTHSEQNQLGNLDAIIEIADGNPSNMDPISNISYSDTDNLSRRPVARDTAFSKLISNKKVDLRLTNIIYHLDTSTEDSREIISRFTKGLTEAQKPIFLKLLDGSVALTTKEIDTLLEATSGELFTDFVDTVPISTIVKYKKETYSKGLFLHTSNFKYIKIPKNILTIANKERREDAIKAFQQKAFRQTRINRTELLRTLLSHKLDENNRVSKSSDLRVNRNEIMSRGLNRGRGTPNTMPLGDKNRNRKVPIALGVSSKDIKIAIGTSDEATPYMADLSVSKGEHIPGTEMSIGSSGGVYAILGGEETLNNKSYALKLNRAFISEAHADILWDAFMVVGRNGDRVHPYLLKFAKEDDVEEQKVQGLSAGHVIDLLVTSGEQMTNPENARFRKMYQDPKHAELMRNRTLYIDREGGNAILNYGWDVTKNQPFTVDFNQKDIVYSLQEREKFIKWMTTNKKYAAYLTSKNMRLNLNGDFLGGRSFRIGRGANAITRFKADENSPLPTYKEFLLDNGLLLTDVVRDADGNLFRDPVISADLTTDSGALSKVKLKILGDTTTLKDKVEKPKISKKKTVVETVPVVATKEVIEAPPEAYDAVIPQPDVEDAYSEEPPQTTGGFELIIGGESFIVGDTGLSPEEQAAILSGAPEEDPTDIDSAMGNTKGISKVFKPTPYKVADIHKDIAWAYEMIGIKEDEWDIKKRLVDMLFDGRRNFALYGQFSIKLYEAAEVGTVYHEAFHRVSLGYFTKQERAQLHRAARLVYNMPVDKFTEKQVNEFLAEKFESYVLTNGTRKVPGSIQKFFENLYQFIKRVFIFGKKNLGENEIDRIFNQINRGDYRNNKVLEENKDLLKEGEYAKTMIGEEMFNSLNSRSDVKDLIKGLTVQLFELNNVTDLDSVPYLSHIPVVAWVKERIFKLDRLSRNEKATEETRLEAYNLKQLYDEVLGDLDLKTGRYENYSKIIKPQIDTFLNSMGIKQKGNIVIGEEYLTNSETDGGVDANEPIDSVGKMGGDYNKEAYERNHKDTARTNIKFMVARLKDNSSYNAETGEITYTRSKATGMYTFVDFHKTWSKLFNSIYWINDVQGMIEELKAVATEEHYTPFYELARKLEESSEMVQRQFFQTVRSSKEDFINFGAKRNYGDSSYTLTKNQSAVNEAFNSELAVWNNDFFGDSNITYKKVDKNAQFYTYFHSSFFKDISNIYADLKSEMANYSREAFTLNGVAKESFIDEKTTTSIQSIVKLLEKFNIRIDEITVRELIKSQKGKNLTNDLDRAYSYLTSELKQIFANTASKVGNRAINFTEAAEKETPIDRKVVSLFKNNVIRNIAKVYIQKHPENISDTQLGAGKTSFYSFTGVSHIMDEMNNLQHTPGYAAERATRIGKRNSRVLNDIANDEERRKNISLQSFSYLAEENNNDTGRGFIEITELEDYIVKLTAVLETNPEDKYDTLLPLPSIPRKGYRFLKGARKFGSVMRGYKDETILFTPEVLDYFYGAYQDEVDSVKEATSLRDEYIAATGTIKEELKHALVQNKHYSGEAHNMNLKEGNAYKLIHFKGFGLDIERASFDQKMSMVLNESVKDELEYAHKIKVIDKNANGKYTSGLIDAEYVDPYASDYEDNNTIGTIGAIADYALNTMMAVLESEKVFFGDPFLFKQTRNTGEVWEDLYKRWFGVGASGSAFSETTNDDPTTYYSVLTLNTQTFEAGFYKVLLPVHTKLWVEHLTKNNKKNLTKEQIQEEAGRLAKLRLSEYKSVDASDGQAWISPTMFRKMLKRSGSFSPEVEAAFNILVSEKEVTPDEEIKLLSLVLNPQKTVYAGNQVENNTDVFVYDKMSMGILFNRLVKDTHMQEVYDRMEARGKYEGKTKIDVVNFASVTKIGGKIGYDLYKNKETRTETNDLSGVILQERYWKNLRNQLVTDSKENFTAQTMGSAVFKIASANIFKAERYGDYATGMDLLNAMTNSRVATSNMGRHQVDALLGIKNNRISNVNLVRMLRSDALQAKKSDDFIRSLKVDKATGRMYLQLDAFPDRRWMYSRLMSLVTSKTIDLVTPGAQLIQSSSFGFNNINYDNSLAFNMLEDDAEQTTQMECRVSIRLFKHLIKNYDKLTHEQRVAAVEKLNISLLGYRTPTQGQNSIVSLKIASFLPDQAGDTIYLPLEFTALTGSDFDIDKLFMMFHNYARNSKGELYKEEFDSDLSTKAVETRYNAKIDELFNIYKKDQTVVSREAYDKLRDETASPYYITQEEFDEVISMLHPDNVVDVDNARNEHYRLTEEYNKAEAGETKNELYDQILDQRAIFDNILEGNILMGDHIFTKRSFNEKKALLINRGKIGTLEEFSTWSIEEQNSSTANQNRIIDIFHTVIRDKKHYLSTSQPLGGIKNQITTLANIVEAAENRGKSLLLGPLGSTTPRYQSEVKFKFVTSAKGVGTFALANSHHSLTQMAGLKMKTHVRYFDRTNDGVVSLDKSLGSDEVYITDWLSAMIDAHVDALKDNYISKLNVNESTYTVTALMLRLGYGLNTFKFMVQPALKEYSKAFFNAGGKLKNDEETDNYSPLAERAYNEIYNKYKEALGYDDDQIVSLKNESNSNEGIGIPLEKLIEYYSNEENLKFDLDPKNVNDDGRNKRQLNVLVHFKQILEDADDLNRLVIESRVDTKKVGATPSEQRFTQNKLKEIEKGEKFPGLSRLIRSDGVHEQNGTMLSPLFNNSLLYLRDILQDSTIYGTKGFDELFWKMINSIPGSSNMRQSTINNIVEEMFSYFIGEFFGDPDNGIGMTKERLDALLLQGDTSIFGLKSKMSKRDYKHWAELSKNRLFNLVQTDSKLGIPLETYLRVPPTYLSNKFETDDYVEDYLALFNHPDSEVVKLAQALFIYSYYSTGFRHRYRSYLKHTPSSIMKKLTIRGVKKGDHSKAAIRNDISLDQFIFDTIKELNSDSGQTALTKHWAAMNQGIFENNWYGRWWIQKVDEEKTPYKPVVDNNGSIQAVELDVTESTAYTLGTNHLGQKIYSNYITIDDIGDYKKPRSSSIAEAAEEESQDELATVLQAKKKTEVIPGFFEFVGINEETGNPVYRIKTKKGFNKKGVIFREFGIRSKESIIQENNLLYPMTDEAFTTMVEKQIPMFKAISVDERMVMEKALVQEMGTVDDARELQAKELAPKTTIQKETFVKKQLEKKTKETAARITSDMDSASTYENPITIFVDGSVRPQEDNYGYGAVATFAGKKLELSGNKEDIQRQFSELGISEVLKQAQFNPSVELLGLISTLKEFQNTAEHILIRQDYIGVVSYDELRNYSKDDPMAETWKSKEPHITKLVSEAVSIIKKIEGNGGSVRLEYIPRHNNKLGWKNYSIANIEAGNWANWSNSDVTTHTTVSKNGNVAVDGLAKSTEHKNTFTPFVSTLATSRLNGIKEGLEYDERDSEEGKENNKKCE